MFDRARQAVLNVFYNVDLIKVTVGDGISPPELTAIVEEAHREHLKVADHAIDTVSIQTAIEAGVDSVEHGNKVTDEQLMQMRDKGIFLDLTPTWYGSFFMKITEPSIMMSSAFHSSNASSDARAQKQYDELVPRVLKSGVKSPRTSNVLRCRPCSSMSLQVLITANCHGRGRGFESRRPHHSFLFNCLSEFSFGRHCPGLPDKSAARSWSSCRS